MVVVWVGACSRADGLASEDESLPRSPCPSRVKAQIFWLDRIGVVGVDLLEGAILGTWGFASVCRMCGRMKVTGGWWCVALPATSHAFFFG
jgi:hypothetical protein